jgi:sugar lactone lactonase YvrE
LKQGKFIAFILTVSLLISLLPTSSLPLAKAEEKNPLTIEKVIGLSKIPGTFRKSQGIAVAKDGTIFIADTGESQIEVYDSKYKYLRSFGSIGTGEGQFQYIRQIGFDQDENLYVLDSSLAIINVFTKEGKLIRKMGGKDNPQYKDFYPRYFAFLKSGELLIITPDTGNGFLQCKVFSKEGNYIRDFMTDKNHQGENLYPTKILVDIYGCVYIDILNFNLGDEGYMIGDEYFKFNPDGSFACEFVKKGGEEKDLANDNGFMCSEDNYFYISDGSLIKKYEISKDPKEPLRYLEYFVIQSEDPANPLIIEFPSAGQCSKQKLYIVDSSWNRVVVLSATKTVLGTIQSSILENGKMYPKVKVPTDIFSNPQGIIVGPDGNYYVANSFLNKISVFNNEWKEIDSIGKPPINRTKELGELVNPIDMAFDKKGNLFVLGTEDGDGYIDIFNKDQTPYLTYPFLLGYRGALAFDSFDNLVVANEVFGLEIYDVSKLADKKITKKKTFPYENGFILGDLVMDPDDNMIVSYTWSNEIVWVSPKGKELQKIGGQEAKETYLALPQGMCMDGAGNIYVCEPYYGYIQKYSPKGELVWTSDLSWYGLSYITMDAQGKLYVTDTDHNVVLVIKDETAIPPVPIVPKPVQTKAAFSFSTSVDPILEGDPVSMKVEVKKLEKCSRMTLSIRYPEDLLSYQSCELDELFKGTDFKITDSTVKSGVLTVTLSSEKGDEINKSGNLLTITFKANKAGTGKVTFETIDIKNATDREILFETKTDLDFTIISKDTTPPILKVNPIPETVYESLLILKGETEPEATLSINEKIISVQPDGTFETSLDLQLGTNTIAISSTDKAGNHSDLTLQVVRKEKIIIQLTVGSKEILIKGVASTLDSEPFIDRSSGRTMVPLRAIAEAIGATVTFNAEEQRIDILKDSVLIQLWIGKPKAFVNGKEVSIDTQKPISPMIVKGRTFLPLRFVAEAFEFQVDWDPKTQGITLTYPKL